MLAYTRFYSLKVIHQFPAFYGFGGDGSTIEELHSELGPDIKGMWDELVMPGAPQSIPAAVYDAAISQARPGMQASYSAYFRQHAVSAILFPATASEAPLAKPDNPQETIIDGQLSLNIYQ